jgi:hypothetical protein
MNFGFKKREINWRLEKCISSGNRCSSFFGLTDFFLLRLTELAEPGKLILTPFLGGENSSFVISFKLRWSTVRKSILKASFFSRLGFGAVGSALKEYAL